MRRFRVVVAALCLGVAVVCESATGADALALEIPAQALDAALATLSQAADIQLLHGAELTDGLRSPALQGTYTLESALAALLAGTDLLFERTPEGTILIIRRREPRAIGAVRIEENMPRPRGANGSTDALATEGSEQYSPRGASVGGPYPQAVKDVPRSVSVLGLPQIRDQGLVELADAVRQLPGVSVRGLPVDDAEVWTRAFRLTEYQVDGGVVRSQVESRFRGDLDVYDRIELLRGADGLGSGFTSPAGLLNLVRKRPLDRPQFIVETHLGAWDDYRGMLDLSAPLAWGGRLRGRAVASFTDRQYFYDTAELQRRSIYAVVEAVPSSAMLLSAGVHAFDRNSVPWAEEGLPPGVRGLPGTSRDRTFILPWERDDRRSTNLFVTAEQYFGRDWQARLVIDEVRDDGDWLVANGPSGLLDPESGGGLSFFGPVMQDRDRRQRMADLKLRGRLSWRGLEQRVAMNLYRSSDEEAVTSYATNQDFQFTPINIYSFDPGDYPAPQRLDAPGDAAGNRIDRQGANLTLDLSFWQPLRVIGAYRWTSIEQRIPNPDPAIATHTHDRQAAPSYLSLSYAASARWTVYSSWAEVYKSNADISGPGGARLDPTTGEHYEVGVKFGDAPSLLATLALFRVKQHNFSRFIEADPENPVCCFDTNADLRLISEGVELGLIGEPVDGVQLTSSYVYSRNAIRGSDTTRPGDRISDETPRHLFQAWGRWRPGGPWVRFEFGGGLYAQSESSWRSDAVLTPDGVQVVSLAQGGYALASLYAAWQLDAHWRLALNVDNTLDREYDTNRGGVTGNRSLYGSPRTVGVTLRGSF